MIIKRKYKKIKKIKKKTILEIMKTKLKKRIKKLSE